MQHCDPSVEASAPLSAAGSVEQNNIARPAGGSRYIILLDTASSTQGRACLHRRVAMLHCSNLTLNFRSSPMF